MEASNSKWRILKTLSNCAFGVLLFIQVFDLYHQSQLDEAVMDNPTLVRLWLLRENLYVKVGVISLVLWIVFRIIYWTIEYVHDHQRMNASKGN